MITEFLTPEEFSQLDGKEAMLSISNWTSTRVFEKYRINGNRLIPVGKTEPIQSVAVEHEGIVQMQGLYADGKPFYFDLMIAKI